MFKLPYIYAIKWTKRESLRAPRIDLVLDDQTITYIIKISIYQQW